MRMLLVTNIYSGPRVLIWLATLPPPSSSQGIAQRTDRSLVAHRPLASVGANQLPLLRMINIAKIQTQNSLPYVYLSTSSGNAPVNLDLGYGLMTPKETAYFSMTDGTNGTRRYD